MPRKLRLLTVTIAALVVSGAASASTFIFDTDPFEGSTALTDPGRQVVGGEPLITVDVATDQFVFIESAFDAGATVNFVNDLVGNLPTSGFNVIVLQTLDNDADASTPFGAGSAANLLAAQITSDGAGFFLYFNSGLDMPRLVYSTNLSDPTADLAILARISNLAGNTAALSTFSNANFNITAAAVPEPSTWAMLLLGFAAVGVAMRRRKQAELTFRRATWKHQLLG